jgi:hypothetical protein
MISIYILPNSILLREPAACLLSEERPALLCEKGETVASLTQESKTGRHDRVSACFQIVINNYNRLL